MEAFTLDTSGFVTVLTPHENGGVVGSNYRWSDLTPFQQGYIEAAWEAVRELRRDAEDAVQMNLDDLGYRHLAPETLDRILKDCEEALRAPHLNLGAAYNANDAGGRCFWSDRQHGIYRNFGPLTPYLGDDGLIYLRERP